jgi:hypothetical protein
MFHNPIVRPVALRGSVLLKASLITVKAIHVCAMLASSHPLRERWVMSPWAGAPATHSPHRMPRKTGMYVGWFWPAWGAGCRLTDSTRATHGTPT